MTDLKDIKGFVFDIDGVMTDGGIFAALDGELYRTFDAKDGFAVRMACLQGYAVGVITGGRSLSITNRFRTNGIEPEDVYLGSRIKIIDFDDFCRRHSLRREEVMYFGDDVPDIPVMVSCGCGVCPSDAVDEVKQIADVVSDKPGGRGFARSMIEAVMRYQGTWKLDIQHYKAKF